MGVMMSCVLEKGAELWLVVEEVEQGGELGLVLYCVIGSCVRIIE